MLTIKVTQEDIDEGEPCSKLSCPVAIALERATGILWRVSYRRAEMAGCGRIILEWNVSEFIRKFDAG